MRRSPDRVGFGKRLMFQRAAIEPRFGPPPELRYFFRGLAAGRVFADAKAGCHRILVVVAHRDERPRQHIAHLLRIVTAERIGRLVDAAAADRWLVYHDSEKLL